MENFTASGLIQLYKKMGLRDPKFYNGKNVVNLFKVLKIEPEFDEKGKRILTPYEILGVLPKFEDNAEKPIVFAIKNKTSKIGKYEGTLTSFVYKKQRIKEEKSVLQTLKERYRAAIFAGNDEEAESCLQSMEALSGGAAREFKDSFYDYSKYYKRMRKQLLLDLFAHFFLLFVQTRSSLIKNGIIKKNKIYRAYRDKTVSYTQDMSLNLDENIINLSPQIDPVAFGFQNVKKVVINNKEMDSIAEFDIKGKDIKVKTTAEFRENVAAKNEQSQKQDSDLTVNVLSSEAKVEENKQSVLDEQQPKRFGKGLFKSFLKKRKKHFHKVNAVPNYVQDEEEEEKVPFSKKEKGLPNQMEI